MLASFAYTVLNVKPINFLVHNLSHPLFMLTILSPGEFEQFSTNLQVSESSLITGHKFWLTFSRGLLSVEFCSLNGHIHCYFCSNSSDQGPVTTDLEVCTD